MGELEKNLSYEFVDHIPSDLQDGVIYISMQFATAAHLCCCGCGEEVVTPISPTDWKLIYDGESISLDPSIGNWSFGCKSHYWIMRNKVVWAPTWTSELIENGRRFDNLVKNKYYGHKGVQSEFEPTLNNKKASERSVDKNFWSKLRKILSI